MHEGGAVESRNAAPYVCLAPTILKSPGIRRHGPRIFPSPVSGRKTLKIRAFLIDSDFE